MSEPAGKPEHSETEKWLAPAIDGSDGQGFLTAERLEALQRDAYEEAYEAGHREGLEAGKQAAAERAARLGKLLDTLVTPLEELDETIEEQVAELAITIAKQLFRREIQIDPGHVVGVVRDTVPLLPVASRNVKVHLHPDDAALVRESFSAGGDEVAWSIVEDPLLVRGGCKVSSDNSLIDAQAETRFQAVVDAISGDERQQ